jgi:hypothetical protein
MAGRLWRSSRKPTAASGRERRGGVINGTKAVENSPKRLAIKETNTKEIPPPRGMGRLWELRALGWSSRQPRKSGIRARRVIEVRAAAEIATARAIVSGIKTEATPGTVVARYPGVDGKG